MIEQITITIQNAIPGARAAVIDPMNDGQHFEALVVSEAFEGLPLVRQHQMVLKSLKAELDSNVVHALALKTFTPAKWEANKDQYSVDL